MKKLILLALVLFSAATMLAQTNRMSYQAVVRNAANELVAEENLTVAIRISDANSTSVFSETHSVTSNRNGVISLMIGEGSGQSGNMASVDWRTAQIHTEVTLPIGTTLSNTTPVNAVPYAFYADSVDIHWVNDAVDDYLEHHSIGSIVETDPTVPAWAKEATKPVYDYSEITNTPDMSGYLTSETDPTVPDWAKESVKPVYDYSEITNTPDMTPYLTIESDPTVNDGTLTITLPDGTSSTFTANQGGNTNVAIPAMSVADLLALVGGMTDAEKEALRDALGVTGGGSSDPTTFVCGTSKMVDADGNEYETVLIGTQCWTKTNLRVAPAGATDATSSGASSNTVPYYYVNSAVNPAVYGYYYNWEAAKLACPTGWHLPSDAEWNTLEETVSGTDWQANYAIATGYRGSHAGKLAGEGWNSSSTAGASGDASDLDHNASGFGAVPAGGWSSGFDGAGSYAYFWSSTEYGTNSAWHRYLNYDFAHVSRFNDRSRNYGFSVRCLRGETGGGTASTEPTVTTSGATDVTETSATLNGSVANPDGVTITAQGFEWKATTGGTYAQVTATGSTMSYALTGLTAGTSYTYRAFVTTAAGISYSDEVVFTTTASGSASFICGTSKMVDADGNEYETVLIGTQCWTKTNLRVAPAGATDATSSGASSYTVPDYYVNSAVNPAVYGYYYNWEAAKLACPTGWHLPSDAEWTTLTDYVSSQSEFQCGGNSSYIAKALASTEGWNPSTYICVVGNDPSKNNATGFSAVPAGTCNGSSFNYAGGSASFWNATQDLSYPGVAYNRILYCNFAYVSRGVGDKSNGQSVRCLRDETGGGTASTEPTVTTSGATDVTETSATLNGSVSNPDEVAITAQGFEWKATAGGAYAAVNATGETMTYALTGLTAGTSYTYRAFVTTAAGTSYGDEVAFTTTASGSASFTCGTSKMVDADGNEYETVQIGTQCWTKTNLRVAPAGATNGTTTTSGPYSSYTEPYYYDYSSHSLPLATRGYLYNWPAANLVCPAGWHLPSNAEWTALTDYVSSQSEYTCGGNSSYIAKALASTEGWNSSTGICVVGNGPSTNNATGFSAVPAGYCRGLSYYDAGDQAYFWCATLGSSDPSLAYYRSLAFANARMLMFQDYHKDNGYSVRCLRD